jgi:hypothetical protein
MQQMNIKKQDPFYADHKSKKKAKVSLQTNQNLSFEFNDVKIRELETSQRSTVFCQSKKQCDVNHAAF